MSDPNPDVKALFFEALQKDSPTAMCEYLDSACGDNAEIREQIDKLIRAHQDAGNFLGGGPPTVPERVCQVRAVSIGVTA
jgi:hypothetical protein